MVALFSLSLILVGVVSVLLGLLLIAPEIRVHQIRVYSPASWAYRIGMGFMLLGVWMASRADGLTALIQVGQIMGGAGFLSGIITWGHELSQARDAGQVALLQSSKR
jgi:hypothetical protein